ncbi:hypothetical protein ACFQU7_43540 [Pseudoroseomonas wenyumeiae]
MSDAAFKIGQVVAFGRAGDGHIRGNEFTVTRVMPLESGFRSYRARGKDGVERAFQESQLRPGLLHLRLGRGSRFGRPEQLSRLMKPPAGGPLRESRAQVVRLPGFGQMLTGAVTAVMPREEPR